MLKSGFEIRAAGDARKNPAVLLQRGYTPRFVVDLFDTRFFLGNLRRAHDLKMFPAFVLPSASQRNGRRRVYARVFYKDSSLVWRSASHYINTDEDQWIGKGAVREYRVDGERQFFSAEETTNLPFEMQQALDDLSVRGPKAVTDNKILFLILRSAPADRIWPYHEFTAPRERAMAVKANRINNNRPIAWFEDPGNPRSLRLARGFEPDLRALIDVYTSRSTMYGGEIRKFRIASRNRRIQYMFVAGPKHVWLVHPQALTTELSSFGLRTVDVMADDDISIPGYEFYDNDGDGQIDNQIPAGYAGAACPIDPDRADASPWNHRLSMIAAFRRSRLMHKS